ncbi:MAG: class I SAM-dependent methyltransferase [Blautia sp.]|nr:class I SAM-dependent methyltransferase [Blautia sp.]
MSSLNDKIKDYWEGEADAYDREVEGNLECSRTAEGWISLVLENAPAKKRLEILDVGTGPGFFPIVLGRRGHHVTGIDLTENMIGLAKKNIEAAGVDADLHVMDSHALGFPDNTFDMVISRNVTWTLDDPEQVYREWKRVLAPGGTMLVFDACWYLWRYDKELEVLYLENEKRIRAKYGRDIHAHTDPEKGAALSRQLFLSDKVRPKWDIEYLLQLGFTRVFAQPDITDLVWDDFQRELNWVTPQFIVGAVK